MTYSIIIPAFNEEKTIEDVINNIKNVFLKINRDYEIIVVCDGCSDNTEKIAKSTGSKIIVHEVNKGYGASIKSGVINSSGKYIITIDADGQHNPTDINNLIELKGDNTMVVAARINSKSSLTWVRPGKLVISLLANTLANSKIPDLNSGLRIFNKNSFLKIMPLLPDGFSLSTTTTIAFLKRNEKIKYFQTNFKKRSGKGSLTIIDGFKTLILVLRLFTLFSPLRIFLPLSILVMLVGLFYTFQSYILYQQSSLRGLIALVMALNIFLFGLIIDQISAIRRGENIKDG